jgi:hypothetical protein
MEENIESGAAIARWLWVHGWVPICPHLNSKDFHKSLPLTHDDFVEGDLLLVERSDIIVMAPDWQISDGACTEREHALAVDIPVFEWGINFGPRPGSPWEKEDAGG